MGEINPIKLIAILALGNFLLAAAADERNEKPKQLIDYFSRVSKGDVAAILSRLSGELRQSGAPGEQIKLASTWFRLSHEPLAQTDCIGENAVALQSPKGGSFGLRSFLTDTRNRLIEYCEAEFAKGLRTWNEQNLVALQSYTDWIGYNEKMHSDYMADRLYRLLNRGVDYLRDSLFDVKAAMDENYKRFLNHYDTNCPCMKEPLRSYLNRYPGFTGFFKHPSVERKLSRKNHVIMRRVLACVQLNGMVDAKHQAFLMMYSQVGDITKH